MKNKKLNLKAQKEKKPLTQAERFSLVPPVQQDSSFTGSVSEDKPLLSPDQKNVSHFSLKSPQLDLKTNLLHLEEEAAFFHFALKEIHDLTG